MPRPQEARPSKLCAAPGFPGGLPLLGPLAWSPWGLPRPTPPISLPTQHLHLQGGGPGPVPLPPVGLPTTQGFCLYLPMQDQIEIKPIPGITTSSTMWPWAHLTPSRTRFAHVPKQLQGIQHGPSAATQPLPSWGVPAALPATPPLPHTRETTAQREKAMPRVPTRAPFVAVACASSWPISPPKQTRGWPGLRGCSDALSGFRKGSRRAAGAKAVGRG